jgi:CDGSH-type Zn-finger protein
LEHDVPAEPVRRQVTLTDEGPVLVHGPVEIILADGRKVTSDRAVTALCVCRRSGRYPFCDTSHRRRVRNNRAHNSDHDMGSQDHKC